MNYLALTSFLRIRWRFGRVELVSKSRSVVQQVSAASNFRQRTVAHDELFKLAPHAMDTGSEYEEFCVNYGRCQDGRVDHYEYQVARGIQSSQ
jgi:hypothetical protein